MIVYRDALPDDGPAIDAMARRVWLDTFRHSASAADIERYLAEAFGQAGALIRDLPDPAFDYRVALSDSHVIGYAKMSTPIFTDEVDASGAHQLRQLYVDRDFHGQGVAPALLDWSRRIAQSRGASSLLLTVWEENARARRFYEKHGFVHVGDYAFQTGTQVDRDLIMRLAL
ncbi:GNAT family N-acetyltransferase [Sphingomonas sp. Mn802worker]|uniref:GNAT family N-acetyltransferase n=1 Tax=Sphingomonas sp. Mn802worker TaxID=629773 RepID=UPI000373E080|nr:GNAT family N-acetyltransferase [Sphingomonas sp. Mn802worker]